MIYVHQRALNNCLELFLTGWLLGYSDLVDYLGLEHATRVSMVLIQELNLSEDYRDKLKVYLSNSFNFSINEFRDVENSFLLKFLHK